MPLSKSSAPTFYKEFSPALFFSVASYEPFDKTAIINIAHTLYCTFVLPLTGINERYVFLHYQTKNGKRRNRKRYGSPKFDWEKIHNEDIVSLYFELKEDSRFFKSRSQLQSFWAQTEGYGDEKLSILEFGVELDATYGNRVPVEAQNTFVNVAKSAFRDLNCIVGYITLDQVGPAPGGGWSPYDRFVCMDTTMTRRNPWTGEELWRKWARGYYWGNFLSENHIHLLGGESELQKVPLEVVERIGKGWYLQLTPDINDINKDKLHALRDLLRPLLPLPYYENNRPKDWEEQLPNLVL